LLATTRIAHNNSVSKRYGGSCKDKFTVITVNHKKNCFLFSHLKA
jgi:hypothetical protein